MKRHFSFGLLLLTMLALTGCSVGMAMSGGSNPDLGVIRVGASRGEVELQLGSPIAITERDGMRVDVYEYEIGNEKSAGRAIGHGVMDILTLGLWEVVGTPIEAVQGDKRQITLTYDENDIVTRIGSAVPPAQRIAPSEMAAE